MEVRMRMAGPCSMALTFLVRVSSVPCRGDCGSPGGGGGKRRAKVSDPLLRSPRFPPRPPPTAHRPPPPPLPRYITKVRLGSGMRAGARHEPATSSRRWLRKPSARAAALSSPPSKSGTETVQTPASRAAPLHCTHRASRRSTSAHTFNLG